MARRCFRVAADLPSSAARARALRTSVSSPRRPSVPSARQSLAAVSNSTAGVSTSSSRSRAANNMMLPLGLFLLAFGACLLGPPPLGLHEGVTALALLLLSRAFQAPHGGTMVAIVYVHSSVPSLQFVVLPELLPACLQQFDVFVHVYVATGLGEMFLLRSSFETR